MAKESYNIAGNGDVKFNNKAFFCVECGKEMRSDHIICDECEDNIMEREEDTEDIVYEKSNEYLQYDSKYVKVS